MKVAVSIPDEIFEEAERLAERMHSSRSRLYRQALREFVTRHAPEHGTESMNRAIVEVGATQDELSRTAARAVLSKLEW